MRDSVSRVGKPDEKLAAFLEAIYPARRGLIKPQKSLAFKPGMNAEQITPQSAGKMPKGFSRYLTTRGYSRKKPRASARGVSFPLLQKSPAGSF